MLLFAGSAVDLIMYGTVDRHGRGAVNAGFVCLLVLVQR